MNVKGPASRVKGFSIPPPSPFRNIDESSKCAKEKERRLRRSIGMEKGKSRFLSPLFLTERRQCVLDSWAASF